MKKLAFRLLLVLGGLAIGILFAEGIARLFAAPEDADLLFNSPESSPLGLYVLDQQTRVIPAPNFQATARSLGYNVSLRTNTLSLRGPATEQISQTQWIALGDSFTMAVQVTEEQSFAGRIGQQQGVHIWNAGVDGYSTWQAALRYGQIKSQLPIQKAILCFFTGNDFHDNERFLHMRQTPLPGQPGQPIPRAKNPWWKSLLLTHSYIYAQYRIHAHRQTIQQGQGHQFRNWKDELSIFHQQGKQRLQRLLHQSRQALQQLRQQVGSENLMVMIAPPAFVIDQKRAEATFSLVGLDPKGATLDAPQQAIAGLLRELGIKTCDLSSALRAGQKKAPMYFVFDGHWTAEGHEVVAAQFKQCF